MDSRVDFVDEVLGFRFEQGFRAKYIELGEPIEDLEFWFRNAQVFLEVHRVNPVGAENRHNVLTLIESIRFEVQAGYPPPPGLEDIVFDVSAYEFPEAVLSCKAQVISLVLAQESSGSANAATQ
jgi:hypothetical protein